MNNVGVGGCTPLMVAARQGHDEIVKKLILADANVGKQDRVGDTALHHAACNNIQCGILLAEGGGGGGSQCEDQEQGFSYSPQHN